MADAFLCVEVPFAHPFVTCFNLQINNWTDWSVSASINLAYSLRNAWMTFSTKIIGERSLLEVVLAFKVHVRACFKVSLDIPIASFYIRSSLTPALRRIHLAWMICSCKVPQGCRECWWVRTLQSKAESMLDEVEGFCDAFLSKDASSCWATAASPSESSQRLLHGNCWVVLFCLSIWLLLLIYFKNHPSCSVNILFNFFSTYLRHGF